MVAHKGRAIKVQVANGMGCLEGYLSLTQGRLYKANALAGKHGNAQKFH